MRGLTRLVLLSVARLGHGIWFVSGTGLGDFGGSLHPSQRRLTKIELGALRMILTL